MLALAPEKISSPHKLSACSTSLRHTMLQFYLLSRYLTHALATPLCSQVPPCVCRRLEAEEKHERTERQLGKRAVDAEAKNALMGVTRRREDAKECAMLLSIAGLRPRGSLSAPRGTWRRKPPTQRPRWRAPRSLCSAPHEETGRNAGQHRGEAQGEDREDLGAAVCLLCIGKAALFAHR